MAGMRTWTGGMKAEAAFAQIKLILSLQVTEFSGFFQAFSVILVVSSAHLLLSAGSAGGSGTTQMS